MNFLKEEELIAKKIEKLPVKSVDIFIDSIDDLKERSGFGSKTEFSLSKDAANFLDENAAGITVKYSLALNFHVKNKSEKDLQTAENLIKAHYSEKLKKMLLQKKKNSKNWSLRFYFGIAFLFLGHTASYLLTLLCKNEALSSVLGDSLEIIGWVAIWEPASYFLFKTKEETQEITDCFQLKYSKINVI